MEPVYIFGYKLAELTKQNEAACVGLFCLAIKDAGKTTQQMNFLDYKTVIQTYLPKRLEKVKIAYNDKVINELLTLLNKNQSVLTMSAR
jgi:hypothetical protein